MIIRPEDMPACAVKQKGKKKMAQLRTYYVSFGVGTPFGELMGIIKAPDLGDARLFAHHHMQGWCSVYTEEAGKEILEKFPHLQPFNVITSKAPTRWFS